MSSFYQTILRAASAILLVASLSQLVGCGTNGPKYRNIGVYSEGLAPVQIANGKWGYINEHQDWVIPAKFDEARSFQSGRAAAKLNGKWGFVNRMGAWL